MLKKKLYTILLSGVLSYSVGYAQESTVVDQAWQEIQAETRDAVVHIFSTSRSTNWFNPYVVCGTNTPTGTGFLINDEGYIVTCSHVVDHAIALYITIPALGKQRLKANVIGLCPQHDVALLKLDEKALSAIRKELGDIKYLVMGDSNLVQRGENVLALGYPGTTIEIDQVKGTAGVVSARLNSLFQLDAPINPGNSGGPLLNKQGVVIGITNAVMNNAQNANFAIPINTFKMLLPALHERQLLKIKDCGIIWMFATEEARSYFNCPESYGCLVCEVVKSSPADSAGLKTYDIIYAINDYSIDSYGEIKALCDDEKMRFDHYITQQPVGSNVVLKVYRDGQPLELTLDIVCSDDSESISFKYPAYEKIDYEIFAGMIIMPLTVNYIKACSKDRPGLHRYLTNLYTSNARLVVANVFSDSKICHMDTVRFGDTINEVNGEFVHTLDDFRKALVKGTDTGYIVIRTTDETSLDTDNVLTVLSTYDSCRETVDLSLVHQYSLSEKIKEFITKVDDSLLL